MQNVVIIGAGNGGTAILRMLQEIEYLAVRAIVDIKTDAPGILLAKQMGITTDSDWRLLMDSSVDIIIDVTGSDSVFNSIRNAKPPNTVLVPGAVAKILSKSFEDKENLIKELQEQTYTHNLIFDSADDGMIVVNQNSQVIIFNKSAERITGVPAGEVIGKHIIEVIPTSRLPKVLVSQQVEANKEQILQNGLKIITTRVPMVNEMGMSIGAFAVFKDITRAVNLAEEITNLKSIQVMLEAIIQSSDEAISVVDEEGRGILINPAYTRLTGLKEEEVIGKPATADIYEGESMHMQVLKTRRTVRGAKMRVGPNRKEVIVNVAPVIVDGRLKGSVGVIHDMSEIENLTRELSRARQIIRTLEAKYSFEDIIGRSEEMELAIGQARLAAQTPATILLRGESGTGKELFAHAIHNASDRKFNKFVRVNCAALSETLLESELFGYEEGAFSGARRGGKRGLFEEANNGSIFLDEIGEISAGTQAKLLRVLQEREIMKVGATKAFPINVRVIAATNVNLEQAIKSGGFREDLYFRLNRMPIHISPLRSRKEDIEPLSTYLIQKLNQEYGRNIEGITPGALDKLKRYSWPGNVRELENILGRAMIFMKLHETWMEVKHLPDVIEAEQKKDFTSPFFGTERSKNLAQKVEEFETAIITQSLQQNAGNKTAAAKALGISIRNLYYKLEKYKIEDISVQ
ncbi:sigma-54 interaction domain-containing protein [Peribacillus deserti]|uniref:Sigma-54-dependent Fis family transcriptional regulator n=1 Tax=Peribacillus deserti TaxID=673318 RepID=A0A2N5M0K1_9BACI|nr:sigma-54-dependent Fis family transcriptional regulator [Peribacillus deserti]PLT27871.1 sigma-54-dependent Fis family transcriptional regulator [Peribacillus deserti]